MFYKLIEKIVKSDDFLVKVFGRALRFPFVFFQARLMYFQKGKSVVGNIVRVGKEVDMLLWPTEAFNVFSFARAAKKLGGSFAEVGVYQGASSKLICEAKGDREFYLFDTFKGLPEAELLLRKNQYRGSLERVKEYLKDYQSIYFYKGVFPDTANPVKDKRFSFVHLDVDLYSSTNEALRFFYPRMVKGGVILSHDYSTLPKVRQAFGEFFEDKQEFVVELSTNQCFVIKF
jgi:hypothetical protein